MPVMEVHAFGPEGQPIPQSVAVRVGAPGHWLLLNACADAGRDPRLHAAARAGALRAVVLMDLDFRHAAGLLALCELAPLDVYTSPAVFEGMAVALPSLGSGACATALRWHLLPVAGDVRSAPFGVPGFEAYHLRAIAADAAASACERVAVQVDDVGSDRCLLVVPGELPVWLSTGSSRAAQGVELPL